MLNQIATAENKSKRSFKIVQPKLKINSPGDQYEQEADAMAERVMRMSSKETQIKSQTGLIGSSVQRKCAECEEEERKRKPIMRKAENSGNGFEASSYLSSYLSSSKGNGSPLSLDTRSFMENAFSTDFKNVRIHTDSKASEMSKGINAKAFTYGSDIYFGNGQYEPDGNDGKKLLAHELTHVVQQINSGYTQKPSVQRQVDDRANDPNFLLCLALCELGMPPGVWREIMDSVLQAVSVEYGNNLNTRWFALRSPTFRQWSSEFATWSTFNKLKFVLVFIAEGKIGFIPIRTAGATAMRTRLIERIVTLGIRESAVIAASQIIRKVAIFLEVAYAAGCATYCGGLQVANAITDFSQGAAQVLSSLQSISSNFGNAFRQGISRVFLTTMITLDPSNWSYRDLALRSRRHLNTISMISRLSSSGDEFVRYAVSPLQSIGIDASLLNELSQDINMTLRNRGGFYQIVQFSADFIGQGSLLSLIQTLHEYHIIEYIRSPEEIAEERLLQSTTQE